MRIKTNESLANPISASDVEQYRPPAELPLFSPASTPASTRLQSWEGESAIPAAASTSPGSELLVQVANQEDLFEAMRKAMDAVEQEKKDRTASYGLLHSHMANFQYDFAVERNERTRLHGDLS